MNEPGAFVLDLDNQATDGTLAFVNLTGQSLPGGGVTTCLGTHSVAYSQVNRVNVNFGLLKFSDGTMMIIITSSREPEFLGLPKRSDVPRSGSSTKAYSRKSSTVFPVLWPLLFFLPGSLYHHVTGQRFAFCKGGLVSDPDPKVAKV